MFSSFSPDKDFNVDLWFCYGSFFYGIESHLYSCEENQVALFLPNADPEETRELSNFLDMILEKPKGLLRVELRVYIPEKSLKKFKMSSPIYLFTDIVPRTLEKIDSSVVLLFSSIQGISPSNSENWLKLVRQISLQNQQTFLKKR
ncbi:MAG: hypothetical protein V4591_10290 [Bdellovibrionota bacterium]